MLVKWSWEYQIEVLKDHPCILLRRSQVLGVGIYLPPSSWSKNPSRRLKIQAQMMIKETQNKRTRRPQCLLTRITWKLCRNRTGLIWRKQSTTKKQRSFWISKRKRRISWRKRRSWCRCIWTVWRKTHRCWRRNHKLSPKYNVRVEIRNREDLRLRHGYLHRGSGSISNEESAAVQQSAGEDKGAEVSES